MLTVGFYVWETFVTSPGILLFRILMAVSRAGLTAASASARAFALFLIFYQISDRKSGNERNCKRRRYRYKIT